MCIAGLLCAGLPGKNFDERGLAPHQVLQAGLHGAQVVELVHAFGTATELAGRLRAAQQQDTEDSDLMTIEVEGFLEAVLVLGHAAVRGADIANKGLSVQRMQGLANGCFVEIHDGIAIRFLVAGVDEGVQGERVVFGGGDFFFDQGAQDSALDFVQEDVHS